MSKESRGLAAWIVLAVAGVASAVLVVVLVVQLARPTKYRISPADQQAMDAGRQIAVNIGSYSRKTVDSDFERALGGLSGEALNQMQTEKPGIVSQMASLKVDLSAAVTSTSLESSAKDKVVVLVNLNGYKVDDSGAKTPTSQNHLELTMKHTNNKWLVDDLGYLGLTQ